MPDDITQLACDPLTFADYFDQQYKERYAYRVEEHTGLETQTDVEIETVVKEDNARIRTIADIVVFGADGARTVIDFLIDSTPTPPKPSDFDIAQTFAHMNGVDSDTNPPGIILSMGLKGGTLQRYPLEFDSTSWNNLYKYLLADTTQ